MNCISVIMRHRWFWRSIPSASSRNWLGNLLFVAIGLVVAAGFTGCRKEQADFSAQLTDAQGLIAGSPVVWRGVSVGKVKLIGIDAGKVMVGVTLEPGFKGKLKEGVKAKATRSALTGGTPRLELFGGSTPEAAELKPGAVIAEASTLEAFPWQSYLPIGIVVGVLLCIVFGFFLFLKGVKKLIALVFALALLAFAGWFIRAQWEKHRGEIMNPELEAQWNDWASQTIRSPEAIAAWESIQKDMADVAAKARENGQDAANEAKRQLSERVARKSAELKDAGKAEGAKELNNMNKWLGGK